MESTGDDVGDNTHHIDEHDAFTTDEESDEDDHEEEEKIEEPLELKKDSEVTEAGEKAAAEEVVAVDSSLSPTKGIHVSRLQTQHPVAPIQVSSSPLSAATASSFTIRSTPQISLNTRNYTNRISLFLFLLHFLAAAAAIGFFTYKAVQVLLDPHTRKARIERRILQYWLPPVEGSALLSVVLAFAWQKAVRAFPSIMVTFVIWASFVTTMAAGILLLCVALPAPEGLGVVLIAFSIGTGLYACWATHRARFTALVLRNSLLPAAKFKGLTAPAYLTLFISFLWISLWCFAVIGALNFYYPPLTISLLVLSLAWTAEVMRNVVNLTVSRVVALYYLRGMQCSTKFCFTRALTINLGSASLGSFFVPTIEALRILARGLNLLEGEDEFMFSCAHCCLHVMESIFHYGNSWAFVHIAAYGRGFVMASQSTWGLFERQGMETLVDSDISSSICFLAGVTSGALCAIFAAAWTFVVYKRYAATVSILAFFVGYLMTRIAMALPQACVACYYVCYAENPGSRLFDSTIPDKLQMIRAGRDRLVSTPRFPQRRTTAV